LFRAVIQLSFSELSNLFSPVIHIWLLLNFIPGELRNFVDASNCPRVKGGLPFVVVSMDYDKRTTSVVSFGILLDVGLLEIETVDQRTLDLVLREAVSLFPCCDDSLIFLNLFRMSLILAMFGQFLSGFRSISVFLDC